MSSVWRAKRSDLRSAVSPKPMPYPQGSHYKETLEQRLWRQVMKERSESACWKWRGPARDASGYGRFRWKGGRYSANRVAYELTHGKIPEGKILVHICGAPACCNPRHMRLQVPKGRIRRQKVRFASRGESHCRSKLVEADVREIRAAYASGEKSLSISKRYNVGVTQIFNIVKRLQWKHI